MTRQPFQPGLTCPARVSTISKRSVENESKDVCLLRIEFEIFHQDGKELRSHGSLASRDLIVHPGVKSDKGVQRMAKAIGLDKQSVTKPDAWLQRIRDNSVIWVEITFGEMNDDDARNVFKEVISFENAGYEIVEGPEELQSNWLTIPELAELVGVGYQTLRRRLKRWAEDNPESERTYHRRRGTKNEKVTRPGKQKEYNKVVIAILFSDEEFKRFFQRNLQPEMYAAIRDLENKIQVLERNREKLEAQVLSLRNLD